jgi:hypothetical protein
MTRLEAMLKVREFVRRRFGVDADPDSFVKRTNENGRKVWTALYYARHFYPEDYAKSGIVDGGEVALQIDSKTGEISILL